VLGLLGGKVAQTDDQVAHFAPLEARQTPGAEGLHGLAAPPEDDRTGN